MREDRFHGRAEFGSLVSAVRVKLQQEGIETEGYPAATPAVTILDLASPEHKIRYTPAECKTILWTYIDRSLNVAQSILGSITEYVLPLCYGLLGAMAAALRLIRRKVDAATLVPTDRARLQQGAILGVLCGAVIGLFANQVGGADNGGGLGLSALAFIAGYNVDGVFRFLDELSDRVFGSAAKAR